ncbi:hypothetical protein ACWDV4_07940 [Micromonospora sp. NPDC003197]
MRELLPPHFELSDAVLDGQGPFEAPEALWQLREQNSGYGLILVEARSSITPRNITKMRESLSGPVRRLMRGASVLVVAPWLSPRTRALLEESDWSYLDLTGNIRFRIDRPAVYIRLQGADRDPNPSPKPPARLHGAKARRLVRLLVDFAPPYRLTDLANVSGLTAGYVSKLLESLDDQAMIERSRRGMVMDVDWPALLLAAAERYNLFLNNATGLFISPMGAETLYRKITGNRLDMVVTGSFAAAEIAPVVAPTQLVLYVRDPDEARRLAHLLPAQRGADVVLLRAEDDPYQVERTRDVQGMRHVALSQLVLDCLGGNGRLPAEGEAVLDWMRGHEREWRLPGLPVSDV